MCIYTHIVYIYKTMYLYNYIIYITMYIKLYIYIYITNKDQDGFWRSMFREGKNIN